MALTTVQNGMIGTVNSLTNAGGEVYGGLYGFKNRLINGAMMIDQRGSASSPVSNTAAANNYFVDRWHIFGGQASKMTGQQSTTVPSSATFTNSALITSSAATTAGASDAYGVRQIIEGFNAADLGWGTANAQTVTVSFWVRSSITGTYSFSTFNGNEGGWRTYVATYTVNAANTWEQKTITIPGDTAGTWNKTTGPGIQCWWDLGSGSNFNTTAGAWNGSLVVRTSGSVNWVGTSGATFYITGVQLEKGSTATSFDYRPYGTELALCQRYFNRFGAASSDISFGIGFRDASTTISMSLQMPVSIRATPSISFNGTMAVLGGGDYLSLSSPTAIVLSANSQIVRFKAATSGTITASNAPYMLYAGGISNYVDYSSEL